MYRQQLSAQAVEQIRRGDSCLLFFSNEPEGARALVATLTAYPKIFAVHENHPYRPWFQQILRLQREGFFGTVQFVRLEHLNPTAPLEADKLTSASGVLLKYGTHRITMMRALLGEPLRVYARLHHLHPAVQGESLAHLAYEYAQATALIDIA